MNERWFQRSDWPAEYELQMRTALMQAVRSLPGADAYDDEAIEGRALFLRSASDTGRNEELRRNRPATQRASEDELRKLADLAAKLERHIHQMRAPAVSGLYREGAAIFDLARRLEEIRDVARLAFNALEVEGGAGGAPRKVQAAEVTQIAALVFEGVSGRTPTFTSDPRTGEVSGEWPRFLRAIFDALFIEASVPAQVRALKKEKPAEMTG